MSLTQPNFENTFFTPLLRQRPHRLAPPAGLEAQCVVGDVGGVVARLVDGQVAVGLGGAVVLEVVLVNVSAFC